MLMIYYLSARVLRYVGERLLDWGGQALTSATWCELTRIGLVLQEISDAEAKPTTPSSQGPTS